MSAARLAAACPAPGVSANAARMKTITWLLLALSLTLGAACGDGGSSGSDGAVTGDSGGAQDSAGGDECGVSPAARQLVQELVHESLMDLVHSTVFTHPGERGFASQLVGVAESNIGFLTLVSECTEQSSFDPYCDFAPGGKEPTEPFYEDHNKCSRLACEAANIGTATMYWTMQPEVSPDVRHVFTYDTTSPAGTAVADPNPFLVWRYDLTTPDEVEVSSALDRDLVVTPTGGAPVDLGHTGTLVATGVGEEITAASFTATFPALHAGGAATLELTLDPEANGTGTLRQGTDVLATFSGVFAFDAPLAVAWCP